MKKFLYNFFIWLSGSDPDIVNKSPRYDHIKHAMYGGLVMVPAILGFISMTYAISTIVESKYSENYIYISVLIGLFWSIIVLIFDRFIVSTFRKSEKISKDLLSWVFLTRIIFATFVGITVAHPLVMLIFDDSILCILKKEAINGINKDKDDKIKELNTAIASEQIERKKNDDIFKKEISGNKSDQATTGRIGFGTVAQKYQQRIENSDKNITKLTQERDSLSHTVNIALNDSTLNSYKRLKKITPTGYIAREHALTILEKKDITYTITKIFLIVFFVFIDILPILWKGLTKRSDYDEYIDTSVFQTQKLEEAKRQDDDKDYVDTAKFCTKTMQKTEKEKIKEENETLVFRIVELEKIKRHMITMATQSLYLKPQENLEVPPPISTPRNLHRVIVLIVFILVFIISLIGLFISIHADNVMNDVNTLSVINAIEIDGLNKAIVETDNKLHTQIVALHPYNKELFILFRGRKTFLPPPPDGFNHINSYLSQPFGASTLKEAWVMAYIEKHSSDYQYQGKTIDNFADRNARRNAIIKKVKQDGADKLFDLIAPLKKDRFKIAVF